MKIKYLAASFVPLMLCAQASMAADWQWQLSPRAGHGLLRIDAFRGINSGRVNSDGVAVGGNVGLLTPPGLLLEAGASSQSNFDWFGADDEFDFEEQHVSLGYQLELGEGWRVVPKVSRMRWRLHTEEGQLFNPGPEAQSVLRSYEYTWEVLVGRQITSLLTLGVSYQDNSFDFGSARMASFVVTFGFK
jgi:hypothetical protein